MEEGISSQTTRIPGGIIWPSVTTYRVAAGIAEVGIVDAKLCMVEQIEGFGAKFEVAAFAYFELLQHGHIKVQVSPTGATKAAGLPRVGPILSGLFAPAGGAA